MTSINPIYNINYAQAPAFKAKEENSLVSVSNPLSSPNIAFKGTEALRAYNYNLVNKDKNLDLKLVEPLNIPDNIEDLKGEKIYNSNGQLVEIVEDKGDFIQVYRPLNSPNEKYQVRLIDKKTNKVIKIQTEHRCDISENTSINVDEFDGSNYYRTDYDKITKQPLIMGKMIKNNNEEFHVEYDVVEKEYCSFLHDKKNNIEKTSRYDNNKKLIKSSASKNLKEKYKNVVKPKLHPKFELNFDPKTLDGNKKYYSNGNIEQNIINKDGNTVTYDFDTQGRLKKITCDNYEINFYEDNAYNHGAQSIIENLENGICATYYNLDGSFSYSEGPKNGIRKQLDFNKNGEIINVNRYRSESVPIIT